LLPFDACLKGQTGKELGNDAFEGQFRAFLINGE
jgi:hypothetical protein